MTELTRKFLLDLAFVAIFLIGLFLFQRYSGKVTAEGYWKAEEEANNKRLFGDAWKDV